MNEWITTVIEGKAGRCSPISPFMKQIIEDVQEDRLQRTESIAVMK